jgi:hypothetical protein
MTIKLTTIADLQQSADELSPLFDLASGLKNRYLDHKRRDKGGYRYEVNIPGGDGRAAGLHASETSGCLRRTVYAVSGTGRRSGNQDVGMQMRFNLGHAVHAMLQYDWLKIANDSEFDLKFTSEVPIWPKLGGPAELWNIHSSCDGSSWSSRPRLGSPNFA